MPPVYPNNTDTLHKAIAIASMTAVSKPLTICVPVYNCASKLLITLDALASLPPDFCDIHILDNCSEDETPLVAQSRADAAQNLFVHRFSHNTGQPGNFNRCPAFASSPYFAWLGAGDQPLPLYYEQAITHLEHHSECALCYSNDVENHALPEYRGENWQKRAVEFFQSSPLGNVNFGVIRSIIARKLMPWLYLLGNDHIVQLNILLFGEINKLTEPLFKRDWPRDRQFDAYLGTCTKGRSGREPYHTTSFRSLDMLWGYLYLAGAFFHDDPGKKELHEIIYRYYYLPLRDIINERFAITRSRIAESGNNSVHRLIAKQLELMQDFISFFES